MNLRLMMMVVSMGVGLALVSPAVFADNTEKGAQWKEKMESRKQELYSKLNLSPEQKKSLEDNKNQHREKIKTLRESLKTKREQFKQALQASEFNAGQVKQIHNELKDLQNQMMDERLNGILELRSILTPEQFKQFHQQMEEMKAQHKKSWGERREKMKEMREQRREETSSEGLPSPKGDLSAEEHDEPEGI